MASLAEKYRNWSDFKKNMFILLMVTLFGALVGVGFIFIDNMGVLLGWLLGSAVNIFAYVTMHYGSKRLLSPDTDPKKGYFALVWAVLRLALYAGCLLLSGFASFKWGTLAHGYCNIIATALALMPTWIMLVVTTFFRSHKAKEEPAAKPLETADTDKKEEK